ncbi:MAG: hypothetical protein ACJ8AT_07985 [Hyalangium sp.]|uniref:hypothetical protein n=1 Tax=Hyalangium sp. TaxID=2028555 RepID=UPI003899EC09
MKTIPSRLLGGVLLVVFVLHASTKDLVHLQEMLWLCHVGTVVMAIGLIAGWHRFVVAGFLVHLGCGTMGWILDALATHETTVTSVLAHLLPLTFGALQVRSKGWPSGVVLPAWLFFSAWVLSCHWLTEPALNVNLSHAAWGPLADVIGGVWISGAINSGLMLVGFSLVNAVMRRWVPRPRALAVESPPG